MAIGRSFPTVPLQTGHSLTPLPATIWSPPDTARPVYSLVKFVAGLIIGVLVDVDDRLGGGSGASGDEGIRERAGRGGGREEKTTRERFHGQSRRGDIDIMNVAMPR